MTFSCRRLFEERTRKTSLYCVTVVAAGGDGEGTCTTCKDIHIHSRTFH